MKASKPYVVREGSIHDRARKSRAKVQLVGGGFANGKTTWLVVRFLELSQWYPGSNLLLGRSTYPKLNDTLRKEFLDWCPPQWIESGPSTTDNTIYMKNGTRINFRYIAQQGKTKESTTSNLLSATFDAIGIDQMEDPEISAKDFKDLMGRLRGQTRYVGEDRTMPRSGPRWFLMTTNPTANWVYKDLVRPLHRFHAGLKDEKLIKKPGTEEPWIDVFEASTYDNKDNLAEDYISGLEATYTGQMRERYLLGKWSSFEGLVHPSWDESTHVVPSVLMSDYFRGMSEDYDLTVVEGYDFGQAVPSCYLYGFLDPYHNLHIVDGFYGAELSIKQQATKIEEIRERWGASISNDILADPSIFRRVPGGEGAVGKGPSLATLFDDSGIRMQAGNNAIVNGIVKVNAYLMEAKLHRNPYSGARGAPHIYISDALTFINDEITEYYWRRDTEGDYEDMPQDRNDHAMNTLRYMLTDQPNIPQLSRYARAKMPGYMRWSEPPDTKAGRRDVRHGIRK